VREALLSNGISAPLAMDSSESLLITRSVAAPGIGHPLLSGQPSGAKWGRDPRIIRKRMRCKGWRWKRRRKDRRRIWRKTGSGSANEVLFLRTRGHRSGGGSGYLKSRTKHTGGGGIDRWIDKTTDDGIQTHKNTYINKINVAQGANGLPLSGNDNVFSLLFWIC